MWIWRYCIEKHSLTNKETEFNLHVKKPVFFFLFFFLYLIKFVALKQPWSVPEVIRPLYESSAMLAQKTTMAVRIFI